MELLPDCACKISLRQDLILGHNQLMQPKYRFLQVRPFGVDLIDSRRDQDGTKVEIYRDSHGGKFEKLTLSSGFEAWFEMLATEGRR